ncbi:DUF2599 domain-containing protein [Cellulomonas sp. URHD0024]|uniref:DUF2599 domain-containing protein n=1 Tax=Cellulomonas sp. URHD0024 TaxID=1302620 RepID=UPI00040431ED|nr:DUF2599 domain-containing protein [Cellulomonas sp. URHD0024]
MPRSPLVVALVVLAGLVASCTGPSLQSGPTTTVVAAAPTPTPTPTPVLPAPSAVTTGAVTLTVQPLDATAAATTTPVDDGSVRLSVSAGEAILTAPPGSTFRALDDGSAVVEDGAAAFVAGVSPDGPGVRLEQADPTSVRLIGTAPGSVWVASVAVQDAVWRTAEGGKSLAVTPSAWARAWSKAATVGLWSQLVAREPDADSPGMQAQLECHQLGAADKETWNLEPWRPDVSAVDMIAARCNPT